MSKFDHYTPGEGKDETERLYSGDISPKEFSTKQFVAPDDLPGNTGLYGENDDDFSAEDQMLREIDRDDIESEREDELLAFGKKCDDYLNNKGKLPSGLTEDEARKLALIYRESLRDEEKVEKPKVSVKLQPRHTELVHLKRGKIAHATPKQGEKVQLDIKQNAAYRKRTGKMDEAA